MLLDIPRCKSISDAALSPLLDRLQAPHQGPGCLTALDIRGCTGVTEVAMTQLFVAHGAYRRGHVPCGEVCALSAGGNDYCGAATN